MRTLIARNSVLRTALLFTLASTALLAQQTGAIPEWNQLQYPPLKEVEIPKPVEVTLSNGMRVFMLENHELPLVRGTALVRTGNLFDPDDKRGLSSVMAEVMRSGGTAEKTGDQLDEELEDIAASVESSMGETEASVSFSGLSESRDMVLTAFHDVLTSPEFRQDKIDLTLNQLRGSIARRNDEASGIPRREFMSIVYGRDNSYGWMIEYEDVDNIQRKDLIDFYNRYYFPKNIMLGVYGDFDAAEMQAELEKLFSGWTVEQPAVPAFPKVTNPPQPGIYFASRADVTQTFFTIGELGGELDDPNYPALEVMANILGDGFSSRLVSEIRTRLGYAYSIGATWAANYGHPGTFRIAGSTKSPSTVAAIKAIEAEVDKIRNEPVTEKELAEAKDKVLNSFVFFFDSPAKTLNRVMEYEYWGYPDDFLFQYQNGIKAVTIDDVLKVANQYVHPDELTIVAVGNAAEMSIPISDLGEVHELDLTIPQPPSEAAPADDASLARGMELLHTAQAAMGGAEALAAVRDYKQTLEVTLPPGSPVKTFRQINTYVAPNHLKMEQVVGAMQITMYTDGSMGWVAQGQQSQNLPPQLLPQLRGELFRQLIPLMLSDRDTSRRVNAVGDDAVEISGPLGSGTESVRVEFDSETGYPSRLVYQTQGAPGAGSEAVEVLSDWRDVNGVKLPFVIEQTDGGNPAGSAQATYEMNVGVSADELSLRPGQ